MICRPVGVTEPVVPVPDQPLRVAHPDGIAASARYAAATTSSIIADG